jgi:hypothetical protein
MILDTPAIKNIILKNPNKGILDYGRSYNKTMRLHLYGIGLESHLTEITGFESPAIKTLRAKYSKSNKDLFARLSRPIDKVFSARGGSVYINLSDGLDKQALSLSSKLKGGLSLRKWIQNVWLPHYLDDPHGVILMEIDGEGNVYPTYKASTAIYDYQLSGTSLEYIAFELTKVEKETLGLKPEERIFRVLDDVYDYTVRLDGENVYVLDDYSYPNFFGYVPGQINSDILSKSRDGYISPFDDALTLADDFLLTGSIRTTHKFLHGFPKYWEYADDCAECAGTGLSSGEKCKNCMGTGKGIMSRVSDVKLLSYPQDEHTPTIAPNVAGYVEPSETYHKISTEELNVLEDIMTYTVWGKGSGLTGPYASIAGEGNNKTATQTLIEVKPEEARLIPFSEAGEKRHKFILDAIVDVKLKRGYSFGGGSSVNYGRRYLLEGADALWNLYSEARTRGAAVSILDDLLLNYLETEYAGDPVSMAIQVKLMRLEPFVHLTPSQVDASQSINPEDKAAKIYFSEWLSQNNSGNYLLIMPIDTLREQLYDFAKDKIVAIKPKEEFKPAA